MSHQKFIPEHDVLFSAAIAHNSIICVRQFSKSLSYHANTGDLPSGVQTSRNEYHSLWMSGTIAVREKIKKYVRYP